MAVLSGVCPSGQRERSVKPPAQPTEVRILPPPLRLPGARTARCHTRPIRERRWDIDERGHGVGDARTFVPGISELVEAMETSDWVAEDADAHLLPHLRRACESLPLELVDAVTTDDAVFEIHVAWTGPKNRAVEVRQAIYALIGSIAESATYIRQRDRDAGKLEFDVVTGMLASDTDFASHGHTLRIHVRDMSTE